MKQRERERERAEKLNKKSVRDSCMRNKERRQKRGKRFEVIKVDWER